MQAEIQHFGKLLESSQKILLINHIRMDGDAFGSLGGLYLTLQKMGKDVRALNDERVPEMLHFLGNTDIIHPDLDVADFCPDMIVSLDAASSERLGESYQKWKYIFDTTPFVVIDHHISNLGFGSLNIIDARSSSTCELVTSILIELGLEAYISALAATFFYTGIQTDTNMYATSNTTAKTLQIGARLIELGANFRLPIEKCFREKTKEQIQLSRIAYKNIVVLEQEGVSYSFLTEQEITEAGIPLERVSNALKGFINETLINIEGVKIAFLLYPLSKGGTKCSMRSKDGYDVNTLCQQFGGGGHLQAAAFESEEDSETLRKKILEAIQLVKV